MAMVMTITMAVIVTAIIDFTPPSCLSLTNGNEGGMKIWCSDMV